jgi:hypothetical protein
LEGFSSISSFGVYVEEISRAETCSNLTTATGYYFVRWTRLEKKKRGDAISDLVEILRNEVPTVACPQVLLDPAFFIGCALNME